MLIDVVNARRCTVLVRTKYGEKVQVQSSGLCIFVLARVYSRICDRPSYQSPTSFLLANIFTVVIC